MTTLIEGTLEEVKRRLNELTIPKDMQLKVTIVEAVETEAQKAHREAMLRYEKEFANAPRCNGIIQVPLPDLTIEQIKELSEDW